MNGSQIFVAIIGFIAASISTWSVIVVVRVPIFRHKPLWVIGCLFGFIGFGINWTTPDDLILLFGITIPVVTIYKVVATGQVIVKTGFPIVSVIALYMARDTILPIDR
ncbi:hypothetical protein [Sphingomonas glacialis]|uniref:hypothetical protein n=1 Tax=Sphingomonas glacialis TaxID=658225 RepID=UPI0016762566|nr:hypothetical protein [Sphingomonas glacialis]